MSDKDTIVKYINAKTENENFDIKSIYYHDKKKFDLVKDVVAFANSSCIGDKYIVFNIDNDTFELGDMDMSTLPDISHINTLLREYCEPNIDIELNRFDYRGGQVAYLKIRSSNLDFPYIIKKDFMFEGKAKLHQGHIYIRRGATNFIANRSDLDVLIDMRVRRIVKIEKQSISEKQVVVDKQMVSMYLIPFTFTNSAKTNFLIKSVKIILAALEHVFSIDANFITNSNDSSFTGQDGFSTALCDVGANLTVQKYAFFKISQECKKILIDGNEPIRITLKLMDFNGDQVTSNTQLLSAKND